MVIMWHTDIVLGRRIEDVYSPVTGNKRWRTNHCWDLSDAKYTFFQKLLIYFLLALPNYTVNKAA